MHSYAGTTALVTGASKGIGAAYARDLAARGADLVLVARSAGALEELAAELRRAHDRAVEVIVVDLADRDAPATVTRTLAERGITVDLLVNNAGISSVGPFLRRPYAPNVASVDVNVTALMGLVHGIGRGMLDRGAGGILNVASGASFVPFPFQSTYGASKAFVLSFTEALAEELRGTGVRVMGVYPGPVETSFFEGTTASLSAQAVSPEQIARRSLDDFARGRASSFPGALSDRIVTILPRLLPLRRVARIVGDVQRRAGLDRAETVEAPVG